MSSGGGGFQPVKQVGNLIGDLTGTNTLADAYGSASGAQLNQMNADRAMALQFVEPSPEEIQQLQQAIAVNKQDIARKQKLLDSSDPALIEAGKQALELMQGKQSGATSVMNRQRTEQRKALENTLASKLGPDYMQSSAGILALNKFDQESADLAQATQERTLGQLLGVTQNVQSFGNLSPNIGQSMGLANYYGSIGTRKANAITGNRVDPGLAFSGDIMRNQFAAKNLGDMFSFATGQAWQNRGDMMSMFKGGGAAGAGGAGAGGVGASGGSAALAGPSSQALMMAAI
jgi:hypothetical protein